MENEREFFLDDLNNMESYLKETVNSIYKFCKNDLNAEVHYRKERYIKNGGGQKQTIIKIQTTRTFFIVIDLQKKSRIRLIFPDKMDEFRGWNAQWCNKRQGENGKREKQIDIIKKLNASELNDIQENIALIYDNALNYYTRRHDSTKTWQRMFGEPVINYPELQALHLNESELQNVYGKGECSVCGSSTMLEIGWENDTPQLFCMNHNPQASRYREKAYNIIPVDVREYVWHRDNGQGICGHNQYLQYDHLIPRKWGGSNTENNIVLKCRSCNLSKSDKLQP
jgi:hypothetical protein